MVREETAIRPGIHWPFGRERETTRDAGVFDEKRDRKWSTDKVGTREPKSRGGGVNNSRLQWESGGTPLSGAGWERVRRLGGASRGEMVGRSGGRVAGCRGPR